MEESEMRLTCKKNYGESVLCEWKEVTHQNRVGEQHHRRRQPGGHGLL